MSRSANLIQDRFMGALVGVLVGDCVGAQFESQPATNPSALLDKINRLVQAPEANEKTTQLKYTDDTAMTISTCTSLIKNKGLHAKELAKLYSETYFREPKRGYGGAIRKVFQSLKETNYEDPFKPASKQFNGAGSFGNGAAMRCSGLALFAHKISLNTHQTIYLVKQASKITHSHEYGINGAVLLVVAIKYLLALDEDAFNENEFVDFLIRTMSDTEHETDRMYTGKLKSIRQVLNQLSTSGLDVTQEEIVAYLGNDVSAQHSVPLAIYSFIRGNSKFVDSYRLDNEFLRTLHWAISCGGDTDTIASMACALCGAYLGKSKIPENLYKRCESWDLMISLADQLANYTNSKKLD